MTVQCLMPNGILIPLDLNGDSLLSEVKEELWCEAKRFPLFAVLKEPSSYNFKCINSMAEKKDLLDETRRLADMRLFCSLLKVVARKVRLDSVEEFSDLLDCCITMPGTLSFILQRNSLT